MDLDFSKTSILVIGDLMLDQYYFGRVNRISPEAPVPIVKIAKTSCHPGGSANVSNNLIQMKAASLLIGTIGSDGNGKILASLLQQAGIKTELVENHPIPTTTKIRVIGEHQQMIRLDFEETDGSSVNKALDKLKTVIQKRIKDYNVIILSDYGKGVCEPEICRLAISEANKTGKITIVDPKGSDWSKYSQASVVTPNVKELSEAAGYPLRNDDLEIEKAAREILGKYKLSYILVTRSDKGMSFISKDSVKHIPTQAREVYDVSGAGDTVVAALAAGLSAGMDWPEAVALSNRAAGIVVGKFGTAPVRLEELQDSYEKLESSKILSPQKLIEKLDAARRQGKAIVFTNGCFDILHAGHVSYLRKARELGNILVVGLNSDDSVKRLKGPERPINKEKDRASLLAGLEFVDYIVLFGEDTPKELLSKVRPDILVKGGDYRAEDVVGSEYAGKTVILPFLDGYSSTGIINKMKGNGD